MYTDNDYINHIAEMLEPLGIVTVKRMFGGYALCVNGAAVAIALDDVVYMKVDARNKAMYEEAESQPFTYTRKDNIITVSNYELPAHLTEDPDEFLQWAKPSYDIAQEAMQKKRKTKQR